MNEKPVMLFSAEKQEELKDVKTAETVLKQEATALLLLSESLDENFGEAVSLLLKISGRVIVSGMGKSGLVGRKIAATLASTGTPAQFVHPAEASHGDLGMITAEDAILALSNSGETSELSDLVTYAGRFSIPLISITGRRNSTLAKCSDIALILPAFQEAGPMGLAPTTSTVLQMGLGDALAIALLVRKGFTPQDFGRFHPGGKLGAELRKVSELMHVKAAVPLVREDQKMEEALLVMTEKGFGCAGVTDREGRLIGIITDGDLRRAMDKDLIFKEAGKIMSKGPKTISETHRAAEALALMNDKDKPITTLFVTDSAGKPVGILHIHDLLRAGLV